VTGLCRDQTKDAVLSRLESPLILVLHTWGRHGLHGLRQYRTQRPSFPDFAWEKVQVSMFCTVMEGLPYPGFEQKCSTASYCQLQTAVCSLHFVMLITNAKPCQNSVQNPTHIRLPPNVRQLILHVAILIILVTFRDDVRSHWPLPSSMININLHFFY
jgi:hypothetical protein